MVMVSSLYSWEWSILMSLKSCSNSIFCEYFWFQDVVNHFRPMKTRKNKLDHITYTSNLKTHQGGNDSKPNTHWYQHISLISLLMVIFSPLYSWEWSILMGLKLCSHSICGEYPWLQDVVNHFRPMKMRKNKSDHITYTSNLKTHQGGNDSKPNTNWYHQHISVVSLLMVMVSPLYSWEWSILVGLTWCSHSICGEYLWFQDVVNHFRPMKVRKIREL